MSQPPQSRSKKPFVILGLVLGSVALAGFVYYLINRGYETTDDAQIDGNIYQISPRVAGQVVQVLVADNQHVTKDQVLVKLDPRDAEAALAKAEADLAQAQAQVSVAQANQGQAAANVSVADAALLQAQQDDERYRAINQRAVSQQQRDSVTATIRAAKAKYDAAVQQQAGAEASVTAAQAQLTAANVEVKNANLQLSYTTITAPAAGRVAMRTVRDGDVEPAGAGLMAVVGDDVWVTANFKETQLPGIHPGEPATITVDAIPGITFKAHVDSIGAGTGAVFSLLPAQNATGNYVKVIQRVPVKLVFDDNRVAQYGLAPGLSVLPSITIQP
ncbi:MAG TPA: HlyD family secretion protein [Acidocella sp.]|jgi:membrane fusion protein (multidrug efflux system)|nr:MAG: secretion protein HlyD [Acidocella sp. 20-58-15]HQT38194.1 HlyD family secretion protein [Acidocella sp.]